MVKVGNVEIYSVRHDDSGGHMAYPRDGLKTGEELDPDKVAELLGQAQFRGIYFPGARCGGSFFVYSCDGSPDSPDSFAEDIPVGEKGLSGPKRYENVAKRVSQVRSGQSIKVIIY